MKPFLPEWYEARSKTRNWKTPNLWSDIGLVWLIYLAPWTYWLLRNYRWHWQWHLVKTWTLPMCPDVGGGTFRGTLHFLFLCIWRYHLKNKILESKLFHSSLCLSMDDVFLVMCYCCCCCLLMTTHNGESSSSGWSSVNFFSIHDRIEKGRKSYGIWAGMAKTYAYKCILKWDKIKFRSLLIRGSVQLCDDVITS